MRNKNKFLVTIIAIFTLTLMMTIFMSSANAKIAKADEGDNNYIELAEKYMTVLDNEFKNRSFDGISAASASGMLNEFFGDVFDSKFYNVGEPFTSKILNRDATREMIVQTYEIKKKDYDATKKDVLIMANLDNFYGANLGDGKYLEAASGAYGSSVGFATLLLIAEKAKTMNFDFNLVFTLVSGNDTANVVSSEAYRAFYGTENYISARGSMGKILRVIDVSRPLGGKYNYVYTGETDKTVYSATHEYTDKNHFDLNDTPKNKKVYAISDKTSKFGMRHRGMNNINLPFMEKNIQITTFASFDWENAYTTTEFGGRQDLFATDSDTLQNLLDRCPTLFSQMDALSTNITGMLSNKEYVDTMTAARSVSQYVPLANFNTFSIISYVILGLAIALTIALIFYFKKHNDTNVGRPTEFDAGGSKNQPQPPENKPDVFQGF